jgi:hypothetical protein
MIFSKKEKDLLSIFYILLSAIWLMDQLSLHHANMLSMRWKSEMLNSWKFQTKKHNKNKSNKPKMHASLTRDNINYAYGLNFHWQCCVAQWLEWRYKDWWSLHHEFKFHCGMWVLVLLMRPYKQRSNAFATGVARRWTLSAKSHEC